MIPWAKGLGPGWSSIVCLGRHDGFGCQLLFIRCEWRDGSLLFPSSPSPSVSREYEVMAGESYRGSYCCLAAHQIALERKTSPVDSCICDLDLFCSWNGKQIDSACLNCTTPRYLTCPTVASCRLTPGCFIWRGLHTFKRSWLRSAEIRYRTPPTSTSPGNRMDLTPQKPYKPHIPTSHLSALSHPGHGHQSPEPLAPTRRILNPARKTPLTKPSTLCTNAPGLRITRAP